MTIIGHQSQIRELQSNLQTGNIAHAYLFSGPRNLGKMTVAQWFAGQLLDCDVSKQLLHPDCLVLDQLWIERVCTDWEEIGRSSNVPQGHRSKKTKAKTNSISIDDVRALQECLQTTGIHGKRRVCMIRSVERMHDTAANALLKILEEPPEGYVFLLTTQMLHRLLPTIVSRVRVLHFHRVAKSDLLPLISGVEEKEQQLLLHIAQGAPGTMLRLCHMSEERKRCAVLFAQAQNVMTARAADERMRALAPLEKRGKEADEFFLFLFLALRDIRPGNLVEWEQALRELGENLSLNVHRTLSIQHFVLKMTPICCN